MATKEQLEVENVDLRERVTALTEENDRLRQELDEAQQGIGTTRRPVPREPSFKFSEGERSDLEQTGRSVSPFTGKVTTKDDADPLGDDTDPGPAPAFA